MSRKKNEVQGKNNSAVSRKIVYIVNRNILQWKYVFIKVKYDLWSNF